MPFTSSSHTPGLLQAGVTAEQQLAVHSVSVNPITGTLVLAGEFAGTLNMGNAWTLTSQVRCSSCH